MNRMLLLLLIALSACSPKVVHYINPTAKFASFESYDLVNVKKSKSGLDPESSSFFQFIEKQIVGHMEQDRNYKPSKINPDLILRYELVSNSRTDANVNRNPLQFPTYSVRVLNESVILLELYNQKKLVWQGSFDLTQSRREEGTEKRMKKAIEYIFTTYPYQAGSARPDPSLTSKKEK